MERNSEFKNGSISSTVQLARRQNYEIDGASEMSEVLGPLVPRSTIVSREIITHLLYCLFVSNTC